LRESRWGVRRGGAALDAGQGHHERDADQLVVQVDRVAQPSPLEKLLAVIRDEDDRGRALEVQLVETGEHPSDLRVREGDLLVVQVAQVVDVVVAQQVTKVAQVSDAGSVSQPPV
jgi:hypothetical protein